MCHDAGAVEAIFSDDPGLTRTVVVRPSQVGGSYLIRRDERAGAPPPRRRGRRRR